MNLSYYNELEQLLTPPKEREFFDRTQIITLLNEALCCLNENKDYFHVVVIHGIGGIGKSRLLKHFEHLISNEIVISISFEIDKHNEVVNNLYAIRKKIYKSCPIFDFALLRYWEMTQPTRINDDFMNLFNQGFFTSVIDMIADSSGYSSSFMTSDIKIPIFPTVNNIEKFINELYRKLPRFQNCSQISRVSCMTENEILGILPQLLGIEIRQYIDSSSIESPVFIFDSYQGSQPYSESQEWLYQLIRSIGKGLFVVSGRENVRWDLNRFPITPYVLECYPEDDAREMLNKYIKNRPDLIELILESTQCVPIYIELALNIYEKELDSVDSPQIQRILFQDRHLLVKHFVSHLNPRWQDAVFDLAMIRLFNSDIFCYLSERRMLACMTYDYNELITSNLFSYISIGSDGSLVKLHDIFCADAQLGRPISEQHCIFQIYLDYICKMRDVLILKENGSILVALFLNILTLASELEEKMAYNGNDMCRDRLPVKDIEKILDVFFALCTDRVYFIPPSIEKVRTSQMKCVYQLVSAKMREKENTLSTLSRLEKIEFPDCFGVHKLSYEAILYYTKSLSGDYVSLKNWLNALEDENLNNLQEKWFYNRIKVYRADCDMLDGKFTDAYSALLLLENGYMTPDDCYSIRRTIGHVERFNFLLELAEDTYQKLLKDYGDNTIYHEYLTANLMETQCYFPPKNFIANGRKAVKNAVYPYNVKNKAKMLYSLAIAQIVNRNYAAASECIQECIVLNQKDGYLSGILFAYMAQAYWDYSQFGQIAIKTRKEIEKLLRHNNVYLYFRLIVALIDQNEGCVKEMRTQYQWLDFDSTVDTIQRFLLQISS